MTNMLTKILSLMNIFILFTGSNAKTNLSTPFIKMEPGCLISYQDTYCCNDIDSFIDYDPFNLVDVKYICNKSASNELNNQAFADRVSYRFHNLGFDKCTVDVISGFQNIQFKNQCPNAIKEYCN
jgi:hypothetical protein